MLSKILDQRAQRVSVRRDQHALAGADGRRDRLVPVREKARDGVFERLGERQLAGGKRAIARIA